MRQQKSKGGITPVMLSTKCREEEFPLGRLKIQSALASHPREISQERPNIMIPTIIFQ
jgi:hypothetical protein